MQLNRLKQLRKSLGLSQSELATVFNISQNTVSCWETGMRSMDIDTVCAFSNYFGCTSDYFLGVSDDKETQRIPVLGFVRAGVPITAVENIIDYEEISSEMAKSGEYFGLKIRGDSMEPCIHENSNIIVRRQNSAVNGDIIIAFIGGSEVTVKQFFKTENEIKLVPFNKNYDVMTFSKEEVENLPVTILGKVVEMRVRF